MVDPVLLAAIGRIPKGEYAIGVSGGADSVALLHLLHHHRSDLGLHVVHLDHQARGAESAADAEFVRELSAGWGVTHTIARREQVEPRVAELPANRSARYRALRHHLYWRVVREHGLGGVLLAHHADDQAETVLQRLLHGRHVPNLVGMIAESQVGELRLLRPLLEVRRVRIRGYLLAAGQSWREDASNVSGQYQRNRLRVLLGSHPELTERLLEVHEAFAALRAWVRSAAPELAAVFRAGALSGVPAMLAMESARRWLAKGGVPADELTPAVVERLVEMASDAAAAARQEFPGRVRVRRRKGQIGAEGPGGGGGG